MTRNDGSSGPSFFARKRKTAAGEALLFSFGLLQSALAKKGEENAWPDCFNAIGLCVQPGDEKRETKNSTQLTLLF